VVRFLFQQALHGPIEADEGTAGEFGCRHAGNLIRAVGTSRMTDVCFRKHTNRRCSTFKLGKMTRCRANRPVSPFAKCHLKGHKVWC
jgi:hypothetical protein